MKYYTCQIKKETTLFEWFMSMKVAKNKVNYLIDNHFCFVDGNVLDRESILKYNDYLIIDLSNYEEIQYKHTDIKIDIVYEDDYIIVVNKPSGYIIYGDEDNVTVSDIVNSYTKTKEDTYCYPAHRLDTDTTGCILFCKDIITLAYFSNIFESKEIRKEYLAIVEGITKPVGQINLSISKDRHNNNKMVVTRNGKSALTKYITIKTFKNYSLINVMIETGRTHQIRVHMSHIGHPLIGDVKYGSKISNNRTLLHCSKIEFTHPYFSKKMEIKTALPKDMYKFVK